MKLHNATVALRTAGRPALVAFLTAGYPDEHTFVSLLHAASDSGCDVIEVGIPFSDPIADGPVIQAASSAALKNGMTLRHALELCADVAPRIESSLVIMSYVNPVLAMGVDSFARIASEAGVTGIVLPDVSIEESPPYRNSIVGAGMDYIDLLAPTSSDERIARAGSRASGFVYLVSVTGVTGARGDIPAGLGGFVSRARAATDTPLYVGFGVSTPEHARQVVRTADGVIIGSALMRLAADPPGAAGRVGRFLTEVREEIRSFPGHDGPRDS